MTTVNEVKKSPKSKIVKVKYPEHVLPPHYRMLDKSENYIIYYDYTRYSTHYYIKGSTLAVSDRIKQMYGEYAPNGYGTTFKLVQSIPETDCVIYTGYHMNSCD